MKLQQKLMALAILGIAAAAPAHAAIDAGSASPGNGELFFSIWSDSGTAATADDVSYTRDLGVNINDWASSTTPFAKTVAKTTAGFVQTFTANSLLSGFLSGIPVGAQLLWNVVGNDNFSAKRFVSTAAAGTAALPFQNNNNSRLVNTAIASFAGSTNTLSNTQNGTPASLNTVNNSNTATFGDGTAYAGGVAYGTNLGGKTVFNTTGLYSSSANAAAWAKLPFFMQYETSASATATNAALQTKFTSANGAGADGSDAYWTLDNTGNLSYNVNMATVAAIPEADTWAMFAAGLLVVGAIARRRMAA